MKTQTEMAVRGVLAMDDEIKPENIERALDGKCAEERSSKGRCRRHGEAARKGPRAARSNRTRISTMCCGARRSRSFCTCTGGRSTTTSTTATSSASTAAESARSGSPARACSSSCSGASPDRWGSDFHKCEAHVRIVLAVVRKLSRTDIRKFGTMSAFLKRNRPAGWCEGPPKGGEIPANLFFVMAHCFRRTDFVHCKHLDRKVGMFETRSKFFA